MGRKGTAAIGRWGMAIIAAVPVLFSGLSKLTDGASWTERFQTWGLPESMVMVIGVVEVVGAVALLVPVTRFYGAALVVGTMVGAVFVHMVANEWGQVFFPFAVAGVASISGWWARPVWFHEFVMSRMPEPKEPEGTQSRRK